MHWQQVAEQQSSALDDFPIVSKPGRACFHPPKPLEFAPAYTGQMLFSEEGIQGLAALSNKVLKPPSPLQTLPALLNPEPGCALLPHPGVLLHEGSGRRVGETPGLPLHDRTSPGAGWERPGRAGALG